MGKKYLTVREVADLLRKTPKAVYDWMNAGVIPSVKIGGSVLIDQAELEAVIQKGRRPARGDAVELQEVV